MKKWPIFLAGAAIAIVGCGGGGGKGTTTTAGNGNVVATSGDSIATVNLPTTVALLNVYFITGQGRAQGDITANLATAVLKGPGAPAGSGLLDPLPHVINAQLNAYSLNAQPFDQPAPGQAPIVNSAFYNEFDLNVTSIQIQNPDGSLGNPITGPNGTFFINAANGAQVVLPASGGAFTAAIGLFPGRQTSVQIFLNDATVNLDPTAQFYQFYRNNFLANNTQTTNPNIQGFMSDYVMFDITKVATPPNVHLADGSTLPATRVYFSGEDQHYGASTSVVGGPFCVFTPSGVDLTGTFKGADSLPPPPTGVAPVMVGGTYTVRDPDPRDITGGSQVTSLQGIWRPVTSVFNNLGTFEVLLMPHTSENATPPDTTQDIIVMVRDTSGNITNLYFGLADLAGLTFQVFPIADVETGVANGEIDGKLSGLIDGNGVATTIPTNARFGRYAFTGAVPAGFKATGKFVVFRQ